jgi:hypothetical protein
MYDEQSRKNTCAPEKRHTHKSFTTVTLRLRESLKIPIKSHTIPILLGHDLLLMLVVVVVGVGMVMVPIPDDALHHVLDGRLLLLLLLIPMRKRNHVIIHQHIRRTLDLGLERKLDPGAGR